MEEQEQWKDREAVIRHAFAGGMKSSPVFARAFGISVASFESFVASEGIREECASGPPQLSAYRNVRWTVCKRMDKVNVSLQHEALAPEADTDRMVRALVKLYDPERPREQTVGVDPNERQVPPPDLRARIMLIEIGSPELTEGFWWTSPTMRADMARARVVAWNWTEAWRPKWAKVD